MKALLSLLLLGTLTLPAAAQSVRETADGERFLLTNNRHGFVLTGVEETIYLGRSCNAFSARAGAGAGSWAWADGGFCVTIASDGLCFPRQDVGYGLHDHDIGNCRM